jgi:hypothetical protein
MTEARGAGGSGSIVAAPFTDPVARRPEGTLLTHKLLPENVEQCPRRGDPGHPRLLGVKGGAPIPQMIEG